MARLLRSAALGADLVERHGPPRGAGERRGLEDGCGGSSEQRGRRVPRRGLVGEGGGAAASQSTEGVQRPDGGDRWHLERK